MEPEGLIQAPIASDFLQQNEKNQITFEDFVNCDDDLAATGILNEDEILNQRDDIHENK